MAVVVRTAREVGTHLSRFVDAATARLAIGVHDVLTEQPPIGTPILTSHAQSNWILKSAEPFRGVIGSRKDPDHGPRLAAREALVPRTQPRYSGPVRGTGENLYASNSVHYIVPLNHGSSQQTPSGFVQRSIAQSVSDVTGTLRSP